ncbi:MAG: GAF domain-containing sensor histidine kinase [Bacteroidota bacterium]
MIVAPIPENEAERLNELKNLQILDSPIEQDYEDVVKLASAICNTPMSLVSLVDSQRQWFKAKIGIDDPETSRDVAFCAHAILNDELMVVPNAIEDERFFDNPYVVNNPNVRFYAGMPLVTRSGYKIGTLCVLDSQPRELTEEQKFALRTLGKQVINMMELRMKNQRLNRLNSLQNKFLAIISHDVRNPLVSVKSMIDMMESEIITADDFKMLSDQLGEHVTHTVDLLNNLIDWGISQTKGDKLDLTTVGVSEIVDSEFLRISPAAFEKKLELINTVDREGIVLADANMLKFIIRNLITNAVKFTAQGSVTVALEDTEHGWELSVKDTGVGMSEDRQKKLFNWENRFTTNGTNNEAGSGLGLLMCKEFAEKHLGGITIISAEGAGTTFKVAVNTRFMLV